MIEAAFVCQKDGRLGDAQAIYEQLLGQLDEPDPNALYQYGTMMAEQGLHGLAAYMFRGSLEHGFDAVAPVWCNLGYALKHFGRDKAALECYLRAYELDPRGAATLVNLSGFYVNRGEPEKIEVYARKGLKTEPENPQLHTHLAMSLLEQQCYDEAWPHYEYRWDIPDKIKNKRPYTAPKWTGEKVGTLAIHGEQGIGDEILFASLVNKAKQRADRVIIECMPRLIGLFERSFGVRCYGTHEELIRAEGEPGAYVALGSLPGILGLPDGSPYLVRDAQPVSRRIGIAWRGGTPYTNKRERTLKLEQLKPILTQPGFEFVSVQYDDGQALDEAKEFGLPQLVKSRDIEEAAHAISSCDLVITVCQTAVHLAGAMGIPCWVLTPQQCAWRYAGTGQKMAWYDSVKLYRQGADRKWEPVIHRVAHDLRAH